MPQIFDAVQITADNTNVFGGRLGADVPDMARRGKIQVVAPDTDWTMSLFVNGKELARDSAAGRHQADNLQSVDWLSPHWTFDVERRGPNFDILLDINVVTAGVGLALIQWEW